MTKTTAIDHLRSLNADPRTIDAYVAFAEERLGPEYWSHIPNETVLVGDFELFSRANKLLREQENADAPQV